MKADERKELEQNTLAQNTASLVEQVSSGSFLTPQVVRILALGVGLGLIIGLWWYLARENRKTSSREWAGLMNVSPEDLDTHAKNFAGTTSGRVARMELARQNLGPKGIRAMTSADRDLTRQGLDNIEAARTEFLKLAEEWKQQPSLAAEAYLLAAEAELTLAGIPKAANSSEFRGDPQRAAEYLEKAAQLTPAQSAIRDTLSKRAEAIKNRANEAVQVGRDLFDKLSPLPTIDLTPKGGAEGPIAPGLLPTASPTTTPAPGPGPGVLPPAGPINSPPITTVTPTAPVTASTASRPTTPTTAK